MISAAVKKHINKLQQKKYRKLNHEFLVEGVKGVEEAIMHGDIVALFVEGNKRDEEELTAIISQAEEKDIPIEFIGRKDIGDLKTTETFSGVLAVCAIPEVTLDEIRANNGHILVLDAINDPGNLGTIIRTADWFGVQSIVLTPGSVDPYNPKVVRSTMGSIHRVAVFQSEAISDIDVLSKEVDAVIGFDMEGTSLTTWTPKKRNLLIFGSESHGLSEDFDQFLTDTIAIPGKGKAESLNLSVAAGIVLSRL